MRARPSVIGGSAQRSLDREEDIEKHRQESTNEEDRQKPRQGPLELLDSLDQRVSWLQRRMKGSDATAEDLLGAMGKQLQELRGFVEDYQDSADVSPNGGGTLLKAATAPEALNSEDKDCSFPMMVMKMQDFLSLDRMEPYQTLLQTGRLHRAPEEAIVHFISHQWLGLAHPDPQGLQLQRIQRVFRMMMLPNGNTEIFAPDDWVAFYSGSANKTHAEARRAAGMVHRKAQVAEGKSTDEADFKAIFADDIRDGYVWLDFASIPQVGESTSEDARARAMEEQHRAIDSIAEYVNVSTYFYISAPAAHHEDGSLCDFASWRNRGWCRLEEWANFLCTRKTMMPIVITDQPRVSFLEFFDFFLYRGSRPECSVFHGNFKCCQYGHAHVLPNGRAIKLECDREALTHVVERMYDRKLQALSDAGNDFLYRIYKVMEPAVLAGSKADRSMEVCSPVEPIPSFLERLKLPEDPWEGDASGVPAIEWAAFMGHTFMAKKLIQEGCPVDVADKGGLTPLLGAVLSYDAETLIPDLIKMGGLGIDAINAKTKGMGITALDRASRGGKADVVRVLMAHRADVNVTRTNGLTPLMSASEAGHEEVIRMLLAAEASVNAADSAGKTPLHCAANKFSAHGVERFERELAVIALLQAKAEPMLQDQEGRTPLQIATEQSNIEFVHGMFSFEQPEILKGLYSRASKEMVPVARLRRAVHKRSIPPLLRAAWQGLFRSVPTLLRATGQGPEGRK